MKNKILFLGILIGLAIPLCVAMLNSPKMREDGIILTTIQQPAIEIVSVTADATALAVGTSSWIDSKSVFDSIPPEWNIISWSFYGYGDGDGAGSPDGATFSYDMFFVDYFGGMEIVLSGATGTIGKEQLSHNPASGAEFNNGVVSTDYCWADTLSATTATTAKDAAWSNNTGTDYRAKGKIDRMEAYGVYFRIYNMTAQPVTSITAVLNGY